MLAGAPDQVAPVALLHGQDVEKRQKAGAAFTARTSRIPQAILSLAWGTKNSSRVAASSTARAVSTISFAHVSAGIASIDIRFRRTGGRQSAGAQDGRGRR